MITVMRFSVNPAAYDNSLIKREKTYKYTHLHKKLKHQSKLFRKKYEIEQSLEKKEKEANDSCDIFNNKYDDKCLDIYEDIEHLEQKLKNIKKRFHDIKF
jgi:hypothetical protein